MINQCSLFNVKKSASLFCGALLFAVVFSLQAQTRQQLDDIQQQIKRKQAQLKQQQADAEQLLTALKQAELAIAKSAKTLNQTQVELSHLNQQQKQLLSKQRRLLKDKKQQQDSFAKQIRSAYMTGNFDYAKMLLNQQDAAKFERIITYYQYLNAARVKHIDTLTLLVRELQQVNLELDEKQQKLAQLQQSQQQQQQQLNQQQGRRKATLANLHKRIASDAAQVEQLQANEKALIAAIELARQQALARERLQAEKAKQAKTLALTGLAKHKGKLLTPTDGRVRKLFGLRRQGQVRWKGILINGNEGGPVKAVHQGKVLYADWLKGFGLVTVLDHGQGYMSLYGHNQALLKQAGDPVFAGETIALVGQSGGQLSPSLYFEIRHKGKALNPTNWLSKR